MNLLDWLLLALAGVYALSGYWQGFITGAFATLGLLFGGLVGIWLAPLALGDVAPSVWVSLGALFIVIMSASIGQAFWQWVGALVRARITWQPVRAVDAIGGAALSAAAVLVVAWALGVAVSGARIDGLTTAVRSSTVLSKVDQVLPTHADRVLQAFNNVVGTTFFPRYLEPFAPERIVPVPAGDERMLTDPDVLAAEDSVFKVTGANDCGRGVEGTAFHFFPGRLMTNAHVVAGVDEPEVMTANGPVPARVVHYDPDLDLAVLDFDAAGAPTLELRAGAAERDPIAVLGYPQDGPYDVQTGRIRSAQRLRSPDIYGQGTVIREVFSLRALVRPGNSGGPVVDSNGQVVGIVFAASVSDDDTGYALTASQVADTATVGRQAERRADTGSCVG